MYALFPHRGNARQPGAFCKELAGRHGLGLAPGAAFGPEGEGFVRWCYAASDERLGEGAARLEGALRQMPRLVS